MILYIGILAVSLIIAINDINDKRTVLTVGRRRLANGRIMISALLLLVNANNIGIIDEICGEYNVHLFIKPHPLQMHLDFFDLTFSNISILTGDEFRFNYIEFYEFVGLMDALITDYSSIAFDYMLIDRPIGYTIDDYDSYKDMRGFHFENPLEVMPGEKIKTVEELGIFIKNIALGKDKYSDERKRINEIINSTQFDNCERVLKQAGIFLD